jgi:hypothetical protein
MSLRGARRATKQSRSRGRRAQPWIASLPPSRSALRRTQTRRSSPGERRRVARNDEQADSSSRKGRACAIADKFARWNLFFCSRSPGSAPLRGAHLLRPSKFAEQLVRRRLVGRMGGLRRPEGAERNESPVPADARSPLPGSPVQGNALESGRVVSRATPVRVILRGRCPAEIVPSVVRGISIAVIDRRPTPPAGHVQPRKLVGRVIPSMDADAPITVKCVGATGHIPDANAVA